MGSFQDERVEVVMNERARAEARASPEVRKRFRSCVLLGCSQCEGMDV